MPPAPHSSPSAERRASLPAQRALTASRAWTSLPFASHPPSPSFLSQIFDEVWSQFTKLGQFTAAGSGPAGLAEAAAGEFETPQADSTRVLVLGATGRVGRVLVRKLLLRGYSVTALVRPLPGRDARAGLPDAVRVVSGSLTSPAAVREAVAGADKVVFCARASRASASALRSVDADGVATVAAALQDVRNSVALASTTRAPSAKLALAGKKEFSAGAWAVDNAGPDPDAPFAASTRVSVATGDRASLGVNGRGCLVFEGAMYSRGGYAQAGMSLLEVGGVGAEANGPGHALPSSAADGGSELEVEAGGGGVATLVKVAAPTPAPAAARAPSLAGTEGLVVRMSGDGNAYTVVVQTAAGTQHGARLVVGRGFDNHRLPWAAFRPLNPLSAIGGSSAGSTAVLDPATIARVGIRFATPAIADNPNATIADAIPRANGRASGPTSTSSSSANAFCLEVNRIKALPGGAEPDFILLSCASGAVPSSVAASEWVASEAAAAAATASEEARASAAARLAAAKTAAAQALASADEEDEWEGEWGATAAAAEADAMPDPEAAAADSGAAAAAASALAASERVLYAKRAGEAALRRSGLGYVICRPGALLDETGGYKALVFDQGNRIAQPISAADVADVLLKSLHDPAARNKAFEVCYEATPEGGLAQYELVAHVRDKATNYLTPALAVLEKNT